MHEEIRTLLNTCEFQKAEDIHAQADATYQKFRSSFPFILLMDLSQVKSEMRLGLEKSYAE